MQCIEYTKAAIEKRDESYAEYTDKGMRSGEAVWIAGKNSILIMQKAVLVTLSLSSLMGITE